MGSFDTASLSTESLEELNLGQDQRSAQARHHHRLLHHRPELAQLNTIFKTGAEKCCRNSSSVIGRSGSRGDGLRVYACATVGV